MSEPTPEAAPATEAPEATQTETTTPVVEQPNPAETVEHWREMAKKQEKRAKENADAAKRLAEIEDAQKTEQQRIAERQTAIERERDEARADGLRYKAAAKHGVGEDYFDLLGVGDEEQISARAERVGGFLKLAVENQQLKDELEALRTGKPVQQRPVEHLRPGASPTAVTPIGEADYPAHWFPNLRSGTTSGT